MSSAGLMMTGIAGLVLTARAMELRLKLVRSFRNSKPLRVYDELLFWEKECAVLIEIVGILQKSRALRSLPLAPRSQE